MTTATAAADAVMAALAAEPATVAELAQRAGLGHSTTGKALVALERDNRVRRLSGGETTDDDGPTCGRSIAQSRRPPRRPARQLQRRAWGAGIPNVIMPI